MLFDDKLSDIVKTLESDGVLLHATDTVWGLACSAFSKAGIDKIYAIKKRERNQPLLLLVDKLDTLQKYVPHLHPRIETLLHFHHKPLTVVYPNVTKLPDFAVANDKSAAIRIINDPFCQAIIELLGVPLMSTSANISGQPFPKSYNDINPQIIDSVDFVSKHRKNQYLDAQPSVMINYDDEGEINFLRL